MDDNKNIKQVAKDFYRSQQEEEAKNKALELGYKYLNLQGYPLNRDCLSYLSYEDAVDSKAIPVEYAHKILTIATTDPNSESIKALAEKTKSDFGLIEVNLAFISEPSFNDRIAEMEEVSKRKTLHESEDALSVTDVGISSFEDLANKLLDAEVQEMLKMVLYVAVNSDASDVHIEPGERDARIRFRLDGVLQEITKIDKEKYKYILSQIELSSKLKLNSKEPQNGRFEINIDQKDLSIRIETMPTLYGEDIVMRIFNLQATALSVPELGMMDYHLATLEHAMTRPHGMILVVGPTGAGKTSTLYAILNKLNSSEVKVITIEDPIEYTLEGATQSQINEDEKFSDRLKAVLREDPDIVMVGEIRDIETAETALQGALTGHLVLSSLHANTAVTALTRLFDMTADPTVINASVNIIIAQRLVRKICENCKKPYTPTETETKEVQKIASSLPQLEGKNPTFYAGSGCEKCSGLGYKGRTGIFEILELSHSIQDMLITKPSFYEIQEQAEKEGMITMEQDGLIKAISGITSLKEILKAISE